MAMDPYIHPPGGKTKKKKKTGGLVLIIRGVLVYAVPVIFLAQRILRPSVGLAVTFVLGTLTILSSVVRFATLNIGTGQENLVCE